MIADHPALAAALANPYDKGSEYILDDPTWGVDRRYLKSGGVRDSLEAVSHRGELVGTQPSLAQVTAEISAGRPVVAYILLSGVGGHVVVIAGVANDVLLIADPAHGSSVIQPGVFPDAYRGGATINEYVFTKA
jgi:ABC-type bacteriocin/lantibiotic exporter with double-glycine peptidase domain